MSTSATNSSQKTQITQITQTEFNELMTLLEPESHITYRTSLLVEKFFNSLKTNKLPTTTSRLIHVGEIDISPKDLTTLKEKITNKTKEGESWWSVRHALSRIWNYIFNPESISSAQRLNTKAPQLTALIEEKVTAWKAINKKDPKLEESTKKLSEHVESAASTSLKAGKLSKALKDCCLKDSFKALELPYPATSKEILTMLYLSLDKYIEDATKNPIQPIYEKALDQNSPFGFQKILEELEEEKYEKYGSLEHRQLLEVCRQIDIFLNLCRSKEAKAHRDSKA